MKTKNLLIILAVFSLLLIASCTTQIPPDKGDGDVKTPKQDLTKFETSQGLKKFSSAQELRDFLDKVNINSQSYNSYGISRRGDVMMESAVGAPMAKSASADTSGGAGASDYSQTNVQVAGVDEADFVKNDDKYIYVIAQNKLVIVDAFPAESAKKLSETKI